MDKYEFQVSVDEIDRLIGEGRYKEAAEIADAIDWTKTRSTFLLCRISDLYKINKRYKDSRDLLEIAYERKPSSRKIIYSLCELELKLDNYIHALQLYNAFINVAPRDSDRFLLQYKLYKKQDVNVFEQISVLEEFLRRDFRERWSYELAELYRKAGDEQSCVRQCDEIVAYFGDGPFVIRALELKQSLTALTPQQEELLDFLRKGGKITREVPSEDQEDQEGPAQADQSQEAENAGSGTSVDDSGEEEDSPAAGRETTVGEKGSAEGLVSGTEIPAEAASSDSPERDAEAASSDSPERDAEAASSDSAEQDAEVASSDSAETAAGTASSDSAETAAGAIPDDGGENGGPVSREGEDDRDNSASAATPEEYTDTLLNDVKMQETIARGMREIGDYDSVLAQETGGQFTMVMEEDPGEEGQADGSLDLEQIMSEWEKIRRNSEQERLARARRRVLERSDAAKRELYGDDYSSESAESSKTDAAEEAGTKEPDPDNDTAEDADQAMGDTRSWDSEEIKKRMRNKR